jgi:hypothetical protein
LNYEIRYKVSENEVLTVKAFKHLPHTGLGIEIKSFEIETASDVEMKEDKPQG